MFNDYNRDFEKAWESQILALELKSPLDQKAREAAIAYFAEGPQSISGCAYRLDVKRETAQRRLERAHKHGWVTLYPEPHKARETTLPRVVLRKVFWSTNFWEDATKTAENAF